MANARAEAYQRDWMEAKHEFGKRIKQLIAQRDRAVALLDDIAVQVESITTTVEAFDAIDAIQDILRRAKGEGGE